MTSILVVDDSAVDRRLTGGILAKRDEWSIEYASNGNDALGMIASGEVDLVVTDLQMPDMDGLNLVQAIRLQYQDLPVILITGQGSEALAVQALAQGAAGYVPKPMLAELLIDTAEQVLLLTDADQSRAALIAFMQNSELNFRLPNDPNIFEALIELAQELAQGVGLADAIERVRVGVAIEHALRNAFLHGNLELTHENIRDTREALQRGEGTDVVAERMQQAPYSERHIDVRLQINTDLMQVTVEDEGPGFDTSQLPEPGEAAALEREGGRGLVLMQTFMDDVSFNERGNQVTMTKKRKAN